MSSSDILPEPLTPTDCDLRDFAFMPLDVVRLRDSNLAIQATGDEFRAAVLLWCASWHQIPAASLPDDDATLSSLAGYGRVQKEWIKVRAGALRGWVKCSNGRLYHPVVAEKARDAWLAKLRQRFRTECARIKKHCQRHQVAYAEPDFDEWMEQGCPCGHSLSVPETKPPCPQDTTHQSPGQPPPVPRENHSKGQGEGYGQGERKGQTESKQAARDAGASPMMPSLNDSPDLWLHLTDKREVDATGDGATHAVAGGYYLDVAAALVCEAAKLDGYARGLDWRPLAGWMNEGIDLHEQILPAIRGVAARGSYKPPRFLTYFDAAVRERTAA